MAMDSEHDELGMVEKLYHGTVLWKVVLIVGSFVEELQKALDYVTDEKRDG